ncbi:hypothetical protein [Escherichia coli]|uniref:hypothetical protein n=1 Tax=Escherichia coli TaxID=562 RepID=UPI0030C83906
MSQLDDTILDALTHVTFPKGFAQAEPAWVVTVDGVDYRGIRSHYRLRAVLYCPGFL